MAEYTYKDVIIDPEDPRVEIGKEYYFGDSPKEALEYANKNGRGALLEDIDLVSNFPFLMENFDDSAPCIIRKKESIYAKRQTKWIADNDVKKGDKVRIVRKANSCEDGWGCHWNPDMNEAVGKVGAVNHISSNLRECGIEVYVPAVGVFFYPYFVLKKVEERYVPFDLSREEDRAKLRGAWVRRKDEVMEYQVISVGAIFVSIDGNTFETKSMLDRYEFLDGTPCGKLVEEEG